MDNTYWHKQTEKPLFPEIEWSRPENKQYAGKLLIVGGNLHGFAAPATAYAESVAAGIGTSKVLLPDALQKIVGQFIENGEFTASTPSGSFARAALGELTSLAEWADAVLFAGDVGRNAETALLIEAFLRMRKPDEQQPTATVQPNIVVLTNDTVEYAISTPQMVLQRANTALVLTVAQLQRLAIHAKTEQPITHTMDLIRLTDWLHEFTAQHAVHIVTNHNTHALVGVNGQVSTTKLHGGTTDALEWQLKAAARSAVWWLQNPQKPFEAMTSAMLR